MKHYIVILFLVSVSVLYPQTSSAAICGFVDAGRVLACNDDATMDDVACTALYTGSQYETDGNDKVFDDTIATCGEFITSISPAVPPTGGSTSSTSSTGGGGATPAAPSEPVSEYVELVNPIGGSESNKAGVTSIEVILGNLIKAALGVAGSLALVAFIFGAFTWLTSAGQSEKVKQGAQIMMHAVIGLFIIFASYGILNQVIQALTT